MDNKKELKDLKFGPLTKENIEEVYQMCEKNVLFLSHPYDAFEKTTLKSVFFEPELSLVASDHNSKIVAFFMVVFRRTYIFRKQRKVVVLKFFVVDKKWRYLGLGTKIYGILYERIKRSKKKCFRMKFEIMSAMPDYWCPGLDVRHTEAYFFLKKLGFKRTGERINLCINLDTISSNHPPFEFKDYKISRAILDDKNDLVPLKFMPKKYQLSFWPDEIDISLLNEPITTFVVREPNNREIVGWASHSVHFPGSFGPTGIKKNLRRRGLGNLLLNWCLWDIKNTGLKQAKILWVEEDTVYFYLKSVGARICEIFWKMNIRI